MVREPSTQPEFRPATKDAHERPAYISHRKKLIRDAAKEKREFRPKVDADREQQYAEIWNKTKSLGQIIRERREQLEMPQQTLADALGIRSSEFISMLEQGKRNIDLNKIPKLAEALGINVKSLCRIALFESHPEFAFAMHGSDIKNFTPSDARNTKREVTLTPEQTTYVAKLYSLPSPLRYSVLNLIDQFVALVRPGRVFKTVRRRPAGPDAR